MRSVCREVLVAAHVQDFAVDLVLATQPESGQAHELAAKYVRYGSSPARRAGAGGVRARAGADARALTT